MPESKEKKLPIDQQATWPLLDRLSTKKSAESAEDILSRLGDSVKIKDLPARGFETIPLFAAGDLITDKYQIIQLLSRGNMGVVYQAKHLLLDKIIALKVMTPDKPLEESSRQRFMREARASASLSHPNIISVFDCGVLENGALYLAMEYLEGETLASRLQNKTRLDLFSALPIFKQICQALDYAHSQGVVHRDLKPSNIMLVKDYKNEDQTILIDFSIAKFTRDKPDQKTITKPGQLFGSPLYMSPEQCQGKKPDQRTDIYSFGCVIYETLCGNPPLAGDSLLATIYKHVNELPPPFTEYIEDDSIPREVQSIVFKTLAKNPNDRYQSASELNQALENLSKNQSTAKANKNKIKLPSNILILVLVPFLLWAFFYMLMASGVRH